MRNRYPDVLNHLRKLREPTGQFIDLGLSPPIHLRPWMNRLTIGDGLNSGWKTVESAVGQPQQAGTQSGVLANYPDDLPPGTVEIVNCVVGPDKYHGR